MGKKPLYIKRKRIEVGLTRQEVREAIGICEKTIKNWESGRAIPTELNMSKLVDLYQVKDPLLFVQNIKKESK